MRRFGSVVRFAGFGLAVWASSAFMSPATASDAPAQTATAAPAANATSTNAVEIARKRVAGGDLAGALQQLASYVRAHPRDVDAARYLGDLYYRSSDLAAATRTYLAILVNAPDDRETHNRLGGAYAAADRVSDAISEFQKSLPDNGAFGHLVDLHRRRGDLEQFEAGYRREAEASPNDPAILYAYGAVLRGERKSSEAVVQLRHSLQLAPYSCAPLTELGSAYLDLGRVEPAVDVLQRCLDLEPDNFEALVDISVGFIAQDRFDRAHTVLDRAIDIRPDGSAALVDLGYLEDAGSRWQTAVAYYNKAIVADPLEREAYVDLGYDYEQHHLYALAEASFLKGLSVSPGDGRLHYLLAETYAAQGKRDLARDEYRHATSSDEPEVAHAAVRDLASFQ